MSRIHPEVEKSRGASRALHVLHPHARETVLTNPIPREETITRRGKQYTVYRYPTEAAKDKRGKFAAKLSNEEKKARLNLNPNLKP